MGGYILTALSCTESTLVNGATRTHRHLAQIQVGTSRGAKLVLYQHFSISSGLTVTHQFNSCAFPLRQTVKPKANFQGRSRDKLRNLNIINNKFKYL